MEMAVLVGGEMQPESQKLVWGREVMKMDIYYGRVKGKYSVELSKLCLASSGLSGWGFGPSDSGRLIGNQHPTSLLRSMQHCSSPLAFLLLVLSDDPVVRSS